MKSTKSIGRWYPVIVMWLVAALGVYMAFGAYQRNATRKKMAQEQAIEKRAATEIERLGGFVGYGGPRPSEFRVTTVSFVATGGVINGKAVIHESEITDEGLVHLKAFTRLQTLNLNGTNVTDIGLEHLEGLSSLVTLNIRNTQVTDEGVRKLQLALPDCKIHH